MSCSGQLRTPCGAHCGHSAAVIAVCNPTLRGVGRASLKDERPTARPAIELRRARATSTRPGPCHAGQASSARRPVARSLHPAPLEVGAHPEAHRTCARRAPRERAPTPRVMRRPSHRLPEGEVSVRDSVVAPGPRDSCTHPLNRDHRLPRDRAGQRCSSSRPDRPEPEARDGSCNSSARTLPRSARPRPGERRAPARVGPDARAREAPPRRHDFATPGSRFWRRGHSSQVHAELWAPAGHQATTSSEASPSRPPTPGPEWVQSGSRESTRGPARFQPRPSAGSIG